MAAGLGFKTFTTGEVLTAADTNGYLMQGVLVFASSAARASAITSPQEGQYSYLKDTDALEYYSGSAWVGAPVGDITGVTAGTGISGGGTSGTVTVTNSMATEITAAGDIIVGTGSGTFDNLPIGTTAQVLTADTTVSPYKVKWSTPAASGGMTLINTGGSTLSGTTNTVSSIPTSYKHLLVVIDGAYASGGSGTTYNLRLNTDTGSNYAYGRMTSFNAGTPSTDFAVTTAFAIGIRYGSSTSFSSANYTNVWIYNYNNAAPIGIRSQTKGTDGTPNFTPFIADLDGVYNASAAISSVSLITDNSLSGGKIYVYGVS